MDTESFGFKSVRPGIRTQYEKGAATERESLMLTGDLNVIDVEWVIQFRREDPRKYLFKTLETYKWAAYKNAFVILGTDSDYYRFLKTIPK